MSDSKNFLKITIDLVGKRVSQPSRLGRFLNFAFLNKGRFDSIVVLFLFCLGVICLVLEFFCFCFWAFGGVFLVLGRGFGSIINTVLDGEAVTVRS